MSAGFFFAILTGIFFGLQGTYGKILSKRFPTSFLTWANFAFTLPFTLIMLGVTGLPPVIHWPAFLGAALVSFLINALTWYLFYRALARSPLYRTMPLTALTPLFLIPVAFLLLGELPDRQGIAGILLIICGVYGINIRSGNLWQPLVRLFRESGARDMLLVAFLWAISSTFDKVAVQNSAPAFYSATIHTLLALGYFPYVYFRERTHLRKLPARFPPLLLLGTIAGLLVVFQFIALQTLEVSYVIAFKRAGVILSVLLGYFILKEGGLLKHLLFTGMIVSGAILIIL